jgi:hypothetical protein
MLDKSNHMPCSIEWQGRVYRVSSIQEYWRLLDAWWDGLGEKTFFRVECANRSVFEIVYDHKNKQWLLARVED